MPSYVTTGLLLYFRSSSQGRHVIKQTRMLSPVLIWHIDSSIWALQLSVPARCLGRKEQYGRFWLIQKILQQSLKPEPYLGGKARGSWWWPGQHTFQCSAASGELSLLHNWSCIENVAVRFIYFLASILCDGKHKIVTLHRAQDRRMGPQRALPFPGRLWKSNKRRSLEVIAPI